MASLLPLTLDELLTTTRGVRKRLDFARPVEREVLEECLAIAQQAPTASNMQNWHFLVVTDEGKRNAIAEFYRKAWDIYLTLPIAAPNLKFDDAAHNAMQTRVTASAAYLAEHFHEVPVYLIPCLTGRADVPSDPIPANVLQGALWGTIAPATWNFMLAARARGLGTVWTCLHLYYEKEIAEILGIPYDEVMQAGLIPVAYTQDTDFKPGWRAPLDTVVRWETW
jgi:nitroreductase